MRVHVYMHVKLFACVHVCMHACLRTRFERMSAYQAQELEEGRADVADKDRAPKHAVI